MTTLRRHLALRWLSGTALLVWLLVNVAEMSAPTLEVRINAADTKHEDGLSYLGTLAGYRSALFQLRSDVANEAASRLVLFENGKPLGPAHSPHDDIRKEGSGRYSHWGTTLWFSSSDGTDPRSNGRAYVAQAKLSVRSIWMSARAIALPAALLLLFLEATRQLRKPRYRVHSNALQQFTASLSEPRQSRILLSVVACVIGAAFGAAAVIYGWYDGDTSITGLGVARFFPVSDAFGYHSCATSIAAAAEKPIGDVWCARRVLYPAMLASVLGLTAWGSQFALLAQGVLVGLAIATFSLTVCSIAGIVAALVAAGLLFVYAWEFVFGLFMTEVLGFTLGLFGLTLLLGFCKTKRQSLLFAGAALISVGLAARAGALFVLPMIPLWVYFAFSIADRPQRARYLFVALCGVLAGPVFQFALLYLFGADASNTGGNFSASLYGLSTGSRDWSQAYRDFEVLFKQSESQAFQQIYRIAWDNIVARPDVFIGALFDAGGTYLVGLFSYVVPYPSNEVLTVLAVLGLIRCLAEVRNPAARLLLMLAVAESISAPLIMDSGGIRVFAVTFPLRVLFCALGIQWIIQSFMYALSRERTHSLNAASAAPAISIATAGGVLVLILTFVPATPLAKIGGLKHVAGLGCPTGSKEIVARLTNESQSFTFVEGTTKVESLDSFRITPQRLLDDSRLPKTWFANDFLQISPPFSIVRVVDLSNPPAFDVKPLFLAGRLPETAAPHSLCVDEKIFVELAGVQHFLIREVRPIAVRQ